MNGYLYGFIKKKKKTILKCMCIPRSKFNKNLNVICIFNCVNKNVKQSCIVFIKEIRD